MPMMSKNSKAKQERPVIVLPAGFVPNDSDVICQRGKDFFDHAGNQRFRSLVDKKIGNYMEATTRQEKTAIVNTIFQLIKKGAAHPHGGFVKKELLTQRWHQISEKDAKDKVAQALRDAIKSFRAGAKRGQNNPKKRQSQSSNNAQGKRAANSGDLNLTTTDATPLGMSNNLNAYVTGAAAYPSLHSQNDLLPSFATQGLMLQSSIEPLAPGTLQQHQEQFENDLKRQLYPMGPVVTQSLGGDMSNPSLPKRARTQTNQSLIDESQLSRRSSLLGSLTEFDGAFSRASPDESSSSNLPLDWSSSVLGTVAAKRAELGPISRTIEPQHTQNMNHQNGQWRNHPAQTVSNTGGTTGIIPMVQLSASGLAVPFSYPFDFEPNPVAHTDSESAEPS